MKNLGLHNRLLLLGLIASAWLAAVPGVRRRSGCRQQSSGRARPSRIQADHPERGDVPGWVMITLMSAVLVAALLALAGPALESMFNQAMDKVGN